MNFKDKLAEQRAKMKAECKRNHETQLRKIKEKRERQFALRKERREIEKLQQELQQRELQIAREQELQVAMQQKAEEQWHVVMDEKEKQARDLLGIAWQQPLSEAMVKALARDRSKELHPDQNPGINPQFYVRMMEARDYLLELLKKSVKPID